MWLTWNPYEKHLEPILTDQGYWRDAEKYISTMSDLPYVYKILFRQSPLTQDELREELINLDNFFKDNDPVKAVNNLKEHYFYNDQRFKTTSIFSNLSFLSESLSDVVQKINLISNQVNNKDQQDKITAQQLEKN